MAVSVTVHSVAAIGVPSAGEVTARRFRELTGRWPDGVWQAPGRVNLIGEHTDYNDGLALPFAIDRATTVAAGRRNDRRLRCWSRHDGRPDGREEGIDVDLDALDRDSIPFWGRYPVGVLWAFEQAGVAVPGLELVVATTVPIGAGLSSSAAFEAAVGVAVGDLTSSGSDRGRLVELCHAAESRFVGVPVGRLDQIAVVHGRAGHGLLVDFRSLGVEEIPLSAGPLVVVDTRVRRSTAAGGYAARRQSCQRAAQQLDVPALRDATMELVSGRLEGELLCRARHVVTENERVVEAGRRLRGGGSGATGGSGWTGGIGDLMYASHASLRDDFEVSCAELDLVVETAGEIGADGARLTGAGFGGCAIVLGRSPGELSEALEPRFSSRGFKRPEVFAVVPSAGAGRVI